MATPAAVLSLLVKTQGVAQAQSQLKAVDANAKRSSGSVSKLSGAFRGLGALAGGAAVVGALKSMNDEYREAQKTGAQTAAVLKSTGQAAKVSRKEVEGLAAAISKKTGIDDEEIQASQNMLLTFTKVRNEAGKGNKIFNQATQVVTDMSVALGQSGKSSAIQLGKALNDPIKGITALRRVGVAFTADQQKQITALVESGRTLDAQKIILKELRTEFGGSAEAQATAGDKMRVSLGNLAEAAGGVLMPAFDKVLVSLTKVIDAFVNGEGVAKFVLAGFQALGGFVAQLAGQLGTLLGPAFRSIAEVAGEMAYALNEIWGTSNALTFIGKITYSFNAFLEILRESGPVGSALATVLGTLGSAIGLVVQSVTALVNGWRQGNAIAIILVSTLGGLVAGVLAYRAAMAVAATVTRVWAAAQIALNAALTLNPIGLVIAALVALGVALVVAYKKSETFRNIVNGAFAAVVSVARGYFNTLVAIVRTAFNAIKAIWDKIGPTLTGALRAALGPATSAGRALGEGVISGFRAAFDLAKTVVNAVRNVIGQAASWGIGVGRKLVDGIVSGIKSAASGIAGAVSGAIGKVNPFGDGQGIGRRMGAGGLPSGKGAGNLMGAKAHMRPFAALGAKFGLRVSSGLRPGAVTSSGRPSHHATGNAVDLTGSPAGMMKTFQALQPLAAAGRLAELIYTPGGAYSNGSRYTPTGQLAADHYDHVHVAARGAAGDGLGRMSRTGDGKGGGPASIIAAAAKKYGINPAILWGLYGAESNFGKNLGPSSAGARGPFQFMPGTAKAYGIDPMNFKQAAYAAAKYLATYKKRGTAGMLAAYNAGPAGNPNNPETRAYIPKVLKLAKSFPGSKGTKGKRITEDNPRWNPLTMGNKTKGPTAYEQALAQADLALAESELGSFKVGGRTGRKISPALQKAAALSNKNRVIGKEIRRIREALKKRKGMTPAKRMDLTQRLSQLLSDRAAINQQQRELRNPAAAAGEAGAFGDEGGETEAQRAMREAIEAQTRAAEELAAAQREHAARLEEVKTELKRQTDFANQIQQTDNFQLKKYLADVLSGQIGGYGVTPRSYTPGTGVAHSY